MPALKANHAQPCRPARLIDVQPSIETVSGPDTASLVPTEVKGFDNTKMIDKATLAFVRLRHRLPIPRRWL